MPRVVQRAYAKVNLALALAPPEPPGSAKAGWHRISTWMCAIDLADDLLVEPLGEGSASTWSAAWAPDALRPTVIDWPVGKDLAWRALKAIEGHLARRLPTRMVLTKRIPAGSGLGGGSADAAAALVAIDRAWGLGLGPDALRALGARLGSDVPFFIDGETPARPALVSGFGETIERMPRPAGEIVLVAPPFGCPTGAVYRAVDSLIGEHRMRSEHVQALAAGAVASGPGLFNDLAEAACRVRPALAEVRAACALATGRQVHVTGSGSAMFVVCEGGEGEAAAAQVRRGVAGVAVRVCALV